MSTVQDGNAMASHVWRKAGYAVVAMFISHMIPSTSSVQASPVHTSAMISDWNQVRGCRCEAGFEQILACPETMLHELTNCATAHSFTGLDMDTVFREFHLYQTTGPARLREPVQWHNVSRFHQDSDPKRNGEEHLSESRQVWTGTPKSTVLD